MSLLLLSLPAVLSFRRSLSLSRFFGKRNGSWTCMVQSFGRAGANLGRDDLRRSFPAGIERVLF